jgi:hypothetical protein
MDELLNDLMSYAGCDGCGEMYKMLQRMLNDAVEDVVTFMYPHGFATEEAHERATALAIKRYPGKIRRIAEYHFDKAGKSGTLAWEENGAAATYEESDTPFSLLRGIIPVARVI